MFKPGSRSWWSLFGVGLLGALVGWFWVLQRLVRNEADVASARVKVAEERYLAGEAEIFHQRLESHMQQQPTIPGIVRKGRMTGTWSKEERVTTEFDPKLIEAWRKRIREGQASTPELAQALDSGELEWGWLEDGRDVVAGLLLGAMSRSEASEPAIEWLRQRVWDYEGAALAPAFRLTMIRKLLETDQSEELRRLQQAESIRAVEGRLDQLEDGERYEDFQQLIDGRTIHFYWTRDQLESLLNDGDSEALSLDVGMPGDKAAIKLEGLERWPILSIRDGSLGSASVRTSGQAFIWIGAGTGIAILGLAIAAAVTAARELKIARMRTDLAASVAHELRTPLAGQRLLLETLIEGKQDSQQERDEYIAMAFRENKRLSRLAEEFLTFSRLERGVLQLDVEAVEVGEAVEGAVESLREKWEDPDCQLSISLDDDLPKLQGDRQALVTILRNLLENAWKYSESPREIDVSASADDDEVMIHVSDNGIGLSGAEQQRIFRQFYQVDQRLARSQEGLGLGLSIVKRLLESMDGRIEVNSEESKGSCFTIRIPRAK